VHPLSAVHTAFHPIASPQYKERVRPELIKPAVDWKKSGTAVATMSAAVAK